MRFPGTVSSLVFDDFHLRNNEKINEFLDAGSGGPAAYVDGAMVPAHLHARGG